MIIALFPHLPNGTQVNSIVVINVSFVSFVVGCY
jgi:hypothetical protein